LHYDNSYSINCTMQSNSGVKVSYYKLSQAFNYSEKYKTWLI